MRAVLHLGYPKTGTTYLQRRLFPQAAKDFTVITPEFENCGINIKKTASQIEAGGISDEFRERIMIRPLLLSSERYLFDALRIYSHGRFAPTGFAQALEGLKSLCRDVPQDRIDIVVYLRRQDHLMHSLYAESKVYHYDTVDALNTLEKYAEAVLTQADRSDQPGYFYDFANTFNLLRAVFPKAAIHLRRYENLVSEPDQEVEFWSDLCDFEFAHPTGAENVRAAGEGSKRADRKGIRIVVLRLKDRFFPEFKLPNSLSQFAERVLSAISFGNAEVIGMDVTLRERVRSHFAVLNRRFAATGLVSSSVMSTDYLDAAADPARGDES
ncbi:MAG: hypothetical protein AAF559_04235 [Pseudomonadota bacterium]